MSYVKITRPRHAVAQVTLDRPERMNAMAFDVMVDDGDGAGTRADPILDVLELVPAAGVADDDEVGVDVGRRAV